jgi:SAM-dependent methyltransferase
MSDTIFKLKRIVYLCREQIRAEMNRWRLMKQFEHQWNQYNSAALPGQLAAKENWYPCLFDNTGDTKIEPIYFYQDAWAFERIYSMKPKTHIDIGSHHKFIALLSKVVELTMVDIRPLSLPLDTLKFVKGSILELPFADASVDSLSSLCVIEHIGLGRYGDPIDPHGSLLAFREIDRVLAHGANFYFSVPVEEKSTTYFNAHRAFNEGELLNDLLKGYTLIDKKYINNYSYDDSYKKGGFSVGCYHLKKN